MNKRCQNPTLKLESEKERVNRQLDLIASNRERVEASLKDAEELVDRLRQRLGSS
jgi:hypothetical protein